MAYLLDTSVFVTAKDQYYRLQVCPGFWEWLELGNDQGIVYSVVSVLDELQNRKDELANWAARLGKRMFLSPDSSVKDAHSTIREWAQQKNQYHSKAVDKFLKSADSFLVAHAKAHGHALVTLEKSAKKAQKRIAIPDACTAASIDWCTTFDMLEREGARFVLAGQ